MLDEKINSRRQELTELDKKILSKKREVQQQQQKKKETAISTSSPSLSSSSRHTLTQSQSLRRSMTSEVWFYGF